mgnify:CR=1 FL=1
MNKPIITVQDLNLWYGQTLALKNINIDIPEKSITALIGPSGEGKTTLLRILLGLVEPCDGTAELIGGSGKTNRIQ